MLQEDIRQCSNNYTEDCYVLKLDLKSFFMSIDRKMLCGKVDKFIVDNYEGDDIEDLRYLCRITILHQPELNCERHCPAVLWRLLAMGKSLFTVKPGSGLAIGNLFAQIFANFLLTILDWYVHECTPYHGRYVDDLYCAHKDKEKLLELIPHIRELLATIGLQLNENKFYLQHYSKGVEFTGFVVKPGRAYICNRVIGNFYRSIIRLNHVQNSEQAENAVHSVNSYLGLLGHANTYAIRRKVLGMIDNNVYKEYVYVRGSHDMLVLKRRHRKRERTLQRIKNGEY